MSWSMKYLCSSDKFYMCLVSIVTSTTTNNTLSYNHTTYLLTNNQDKKCWKECYSYYTEMVSKNNDTMLHVVVIINLGIHFLGHPVSRHIFLWSVSINSWCCITITTLLMVILTIFLNNKVIRCAWNHNWYYYRSCWLIIPYLAFQLVVSLFAEHKH